MHYIRLLRPPAIEVLPKGRSTIALLLTITTDLGDTFLYPEEPVELNFALEGDTSLQDTRHLQTTATSSSSWQPGMRVLKTKLALDKPLPTDQSIALVISAADTPSLHISLRSSAQLLQWHGTAKAKPSDGLIAPLTLRLARGEDASDVAIRDMVLACGPTAKIDISIEEDLGESIARHIWDAGLTTAAFLADACWNKDNPCSTTELFSLKGKKRISIIELGCGVGVLGISIAMLMPHIVQGESFGLAKTHVLMTDLPEAEERASSNISRCQTSKNWTGDKTRLEYENLDWVDGSVGSFGAKASATLWDLVVLSDCTYNVDVFPLLVKTLSSIHAHNLKLSAPDDHSSYTTRVLLSTKPRHDSETALFEQLAAEGWCHRLAVGVPILKINEGDEVVDIYSITKTGTSKNASPPANGLKRKGSNSAGAAKRKTPSKTSQ